MARPSPSPAASSPQAEARAPLTTTCEDSDEHHGGPSPAPHKDRLLTHPGETLPRPKPRPPPWAQVLPTAAPWGRTQNRLTNLSFNTVPFLLRLCEASPAPAPQQHLHRAGAGGGGGGGGRRRPQHCPCPGAYSQATTSCTTPLGFISSYFTALPPSGSPHILAAVHFIL